MKAALGELERAMKKSASVAALLLLATLGAGSVHALDPPPVLAGSTSVEVVGSHGMRLTLPAEARIEATDITFTLSSGTYAQFVLSEDSHPQCARPPMCLTHWGWVVAEWDRVAGTPQHDIIGTHYDSGLVHAGGLTLYIVSDGVATVTIDVPGTSGVRAYRATGSIDASLQELPGSCSPPASCAILGYGGETARVGSPGLVTAVSFSAHSGDIGTGFVSTRNCVYPGGQPARSTDPSAYPYGCAAGPDEYDLANPVPAIDRWLLPQADLLIQGTTRGRISIQSYFPPTTGEQYVGFQAVEASASTGGFGGYGVWLTAGIQCSSGDWLAC